MRTSIAITTIDHHGYMPIHWKWATMCSTITPAASAMLITPPRSIMAPIATTAMPMRRNPTPCRLVEDPDAVDALHVGLVADDCRQAGQCAEHAGDDHHQPGEGDPSNPGSRRRCR